MRYFFNKSGAVHDPDNVGHEFAGIDEARIGAVRYASEVMRDHPTLVWGGEDFRVEVTNGERLLLFTVIVFGVDAPTMQKR